MSKFYLLRDVHTPVDFKLVDGCVSGVGGPQVEPGAKRGGGPGGARAVF